jgi:hypothetical protein
MRLELDVRSVEGKERNLLFMVETVEFNARIAMIAIHFRQEDEGIRG